jgi:flagellar motility protein MotE (MotC chaperone)
MKPVLVFALSFVVATAASTGAKVVLTKPAAKPHVAADSTHADSTRADSTHADSAKAEPKSSTDTAVVASGAPVTPPSDTAHPAAAAPTPTPQAAQNSKLEAAVQQATQAAAKSDTAAVESEKRIAKVFTSMDAKQAAKVLEHMTDNDVKVILGYVGVKQAAQILSALPPERVANLSKLSRGGGTK